MKIKFIYLDTPFWRAEVGRLALFIGGIEFQDVRITRDEFLRSRKTGKLDDGTIIPFRQIPCLNVDGTSSSLPGLTLFANQTVYPGLHVTSTTIRDRSDTNYCFNAIASPQTAPSGWQLERYARTASFRLYPVWSRMLRDLKLSAANKNPLYLFRKR